MYSIERTERLLVKRIAGKIVPAIATTTGAIAGLASIELVKMAQAWRLDKFRNYFINLGLPFMLACEPGAYVKMKLKNTS